MTTVKSGWGGDECQTLKVKNTTVFPIPFAKNSNFGKTS